MRVREFEFYVLTATDFNQLLLNRLRELEQGLAGVLMEFTELRAVREMIDRETQEGVYESVVAKSAELNQSLTEIQNRIDALRALSPEFDKPKEE